MKESPPKTALRDAAFAGVAAGLVMTLWAGGWLRALDRPVGDLLLRLPRLGAAPEVPISAVLIDDEAIAAFGSLPWPRRRLARLVREVYALGARGVVIDLILSEPGDEAGDRDLEEVLAAGTTVLAAVVRPGGEWLLPAPRLGGSRHAAHAHGETGRDGIMRSIAASKQAGALALPALAVAALRLAGGDTAYAPGQRLRCDFRIPPQAIHRLSAAALLEGALAPGAFQDRIVFIGLSAAGATDQFILPTTGSRAPVPGVLVHASVAAALLTGGLVDPLPVGWTVAAVLVLAIIVQRMRTAAGKLRLLRLTALAVAVVLLAPLALWGLKSILPVVTLVSALVVSALLREGAESRLAEREAGALLRSLVAEQGREETPPVGAAGRLRALRRLQAQLVRDRDLRRTLLENLAEGVILWDRHGEPLLANAATVRLWGSVPRRQEVAGHLTAAAVGSTELRHLGRDLEVEVRALEEGCLGLIRDVSLRHELDRRRREMQRLVAHELKTPLASLAGFGQMLERYALEPDELSRVAGLIRSEAERLGEMVSSFLDLERLQSGRYEGERTAIDLAQLAEDRRRILTAAAVGKDQQIRLRVSGSTAVVGVAELLARVVDNLVGNALKFSPAATAIELRIRGEPREVVLEVSDQGPGIPPQAQPHLFERFYRVPGVESSGSGLGLALVREIVDWHGGCVSVRSEPGAGTTFTVTLPAQDGGSDSG